VTNAFDWLEKLWEGVRARRAVATVLVAAFAAALVAIEAARRGLLPAGWPVPTSHFRAVELALWLLLAFEVVGLVFGLARSVASAAGKQFEIFSLILLRHSFEELGHLKEPLVWDDASSAALRMLANGFGALLIFVVLGFYYGAQRHHPLSEDAGDTRRFIAAKKAIALGLLATFAAIAGRSLASERPDFFESFYTVLVFADVFLVLLSLRYSSAYHVVFRNTGLAVATVLLRVALSAPPFFNAALGLAAALFALGLTLAYNRLAPVLTRERERERAAALAATGR
jgi:hypothetical protein